jgi:hypothetical protein
MRSFVTGVFDKNTACAWRLRVAFSLEAIRALRTSRRNPLDLWLYLLACTQNVIKGSILQHQHYDMFDWVCIRHCVLPSGMSFNIITGRELFAFAVAQTRCSRDEIQPRFAN